MTSIEKNLQFIQYNLEKGAYTIAAKECVGLIEQALRQLFKEQLTRLDEKDRLKVQEAERKKGRGTRGADHFTMGQLVNFFRESNFLDAWAKASGKEITNIRMINLDEVTRLRNDLIHNGREATRTEAEFLLHCLRVLRETFEMKILEGEEQLPVSTAGSVTKETRERPNVEGDASFENGYALIIGVGADLPATVQDAIGFRDILLDRGRCAYHQQHVIHLTEENATRQDILSALDALAQSTNADSTVVVYFSGHGYQVASTMGESYYLMPYGYSVQRLYDTAINGSEFADKLRAIPAKKLLVLLDCCHAGGVGDAKTPGVDMTKKPLPQEVLPLLAEGSGRVLIASSTEGELSYAGKPYSAFTLAIIEALCGVGAAKLDGYVRVADLALHAREVVPGRTGGKQHPVLHFEHADNFAIAYYAGGDTQPKNLPFSEEAEQIETSESTNSSTTIQNAIVTNGGDLNVEGQGNVVGGNITIGNGNVIGQGNVNLGVQSPSEVSKENESLMSSLLSKVSDILKK